MRFSLEFSCCKVTGINCCSNGCRSKRVPNAFECFIPALVNLSGSPFNELKSPSFGIRSVTRSRLSHSLSNFFLRKDTGKFNLSFFCSRKISLRCKFQRFPVGSYNPAGSSFLKIQFQKLIVPLTAVVDVQIQTFFSHLLDFSFLVLHSFSPL